MSNRELCAKLMDSVPEYKLGYLLAYLQGLIADEPDDDAFCAGLIAAYERDPDRGESFTLEECKRDWGLA